MVYTSSLLLLIIVLFCVIVLSVNKSDNMLIRPFAGLQNCYKMCENECMSKEELKNAITTAEDVIKKLCIIEPPILAKKIAECFGLSVKYIDFEKVDEKYSCISGFIDTKTKNLYVNALEDPKRQNFTIAHELGHFLLGHTEKQEYTVLYRGNELSDSLLEKEANCFAANLLVPADVLRKFVKKYPFATNEQLGNVFGVSDIVIKYRKQHLGIKI